MPAHFLDWSSRDQKDAPWWPRYCPDPKQPCPMQTMRWDPWQMGRQCTIWWWWWCWWVFPSLVKKFSIVELGSLDLFRKGGIFQSCNLLYFFQLQLFDWFESYLQYWAHMAWNFLHMELFGWTETVMFNDRVQNDWAAFPEAHKTHCKLHFEIMIEHRHTGTVYRDNAKAHAHPTWTYWALPFFGRWVRRHFRDERLPNVTFQGATNQGPVKVHLGVLGKIWTVDAKGTFKDNKTSDMFEGLMTIQWLSLHSWSSLCIAPFGRLWCCWATCGRCHGGWRFVECCLMGGACEQAVVPLSCVQVGPWVPPWR